MTGSNGEKEHRTLQLRQRGGPHVGRRRVPTFVKPGVEIFLVLLLAVLTVAVVANQARPGDVGAPVQSAAPTLAPSPPGERSGTLASSPPPAETHVAVGPRFPSMQNPPTGSGHGQSMLWFGSGAWWGLLIDASSASYRIHRLETDWTWADTGVVVDGRPGVQADVLSSEEHLYVASGGITRHADQHVRLTRFSFDAAIQGYVVDAGFPVQLTETGVEHLTIALDSSGTLWVSYILDRQVWVQRTDDSGLTPQAPTPLAGGMASSAAEMSAIVAYGDRVGVTWSDRTDDAIYFASRGDGDPPEAWSAPTAILQGGNVADDHVSARGLDGPGGAALFVVVKTSRDVVPMADPDDAQLLLLELSPNGTWEDHVVGRLSDRHTRPLLLIDEDKRQLHVFAISPFGGGSVYSKMTSADDIEFAPGKGEPVVHMPDRPLITGITSTKQNLGIATGMLILAADGETNHYVHALLSLRHDSAP